MKWIFILLVTILTACEQYGTLLDTPILPFGSRSVLIDMHINEVKDELLDAGFLIYQDSIGYKTNIIKLKHVGYVQYHLDMHGNFTTIEVLHNDIDYKKLQKLEYKNDSTMQSFNYLLELFESKEIYYEK
jgi:hypothetical protein